MRKPIAFATGWRVERGEDSFIHVLPRHDSQAHVARFDCACRPMVDIVGLRVFVHNAADGREHYEQLPMM